MMKHFWGLMAALSVAGVLVLIFLAWRDGGLFLLELGMSTC
jgi:hypothetical protein